MSLPLPSQDNRDNKSIASQHKFEAARDSITNLLWSVANGSEINLRKAVDDCCRSEDGEILTPAVVFNTFLDGNQRGSLHFAAKNGHTDICKYIMSCEGNPNLIDGEGETPVTHAARHNHQETVMTLINLGADPNLRAAVRENQTIPCLPLHYAAMASNTTLIEFLLNRGASVDTPAFMGSPLLYCAGGDSRSKLGALELLLKAGANINTSLADGETALILSIVTTSGLLVYNLLLDHVSDPAMRLNGGATALHVAAGMNDLDAASALLSGGLSSNRKIADASLIDDQSLRPIDIAAQSGHRQMVSMLLPHTAKPSDWNEPWTVEAIMQHGSKQVLSSAAAATAEIAAVKESVNSANYAKNLGNNMFSANNYEEADQLYTLALAHLLTSKNVYHDAEIAGALLSNRSCCRIHRGKRLGGLQSIAGRASFEAALADAAAAKAARPDWYKGAYREAIAYEALAMYADAAASYWECLQLNPVVERDHIRDKFEEMALKAKQ